MKHARTIGEGGAVARERAMNNDVDSVWQSKETNMHLRIKVTFVLATMARNPYFHCQRCDLLN